MAASFHLDEDQLAFRDTVRSLCAQQVAPNAAEADATGTFPKQSWEALSSIGLPGLTLPASVGGSEADLVTWAMAVEEVGYACAASAVTLLVHAGASGLIAAMGTPEQRERWLPAAASGERMFAFAQSEAHAGSDVAAISCRAERAPRGEGWVLDGRKHWITSAGVAGAYLVFAKTSPDAGAKGISLFIVDADAPGLSIGGVEDKMGLRGSPTGEIVLDEVHVGDDALLGAVDAGFATSMKFLDRSRPMIASQAVGVARAAFDAACGYVQERTAFGQAVSEFQGVQFMLADMRIGIDTARSQIFHAASLLESRPPGDIEASIAASVAKTHATDVAMQVTTDAVQLFGGAGCVRDNPVERHMRDAKVFQIYEGTNQIQRWIIARKLLA